MRKRLSELLALASLALLVFTAALWVRSYWRLDSVSTRQRISYQAMTRITTFFHVMSSRGGLKFARYRYDGPFITPLTPDVGPILKWNSQPDPAALVRLSPNLWNRLNFDWYTSQSRLAFQTEEIRVVVLPHWLLCLVCAIWPTVMFQRRRRLHRRVREGMCPICGYDLRASPERCPECGTSRKVAGVSPVAARVT